MLYSFYFIQLATSLGTSSLFDFVFGFQKYCLCRCGLARHISDNVRAGRLLGGEFIYPHQFPWLATVNAGSSSAVGSLISDRHIISAASPLYGFSAGNLTVTLGAHDRCGEGDPALVNSVSSLSIHPGYSPTNGDNDIALLRLRHTVAFNDFVSPVCMPLYGSEERGRIAWTVSWTEYPGNSTCTPRVTSLPMLSKRSCLAATDEPALTTADKGCLGPLGSKNVICKSDVGAPVMTRWTSGTPFRLVGVVSLASCQELNPPLYTRINAHYGWIHSHVRNDCQCF
ncbi:hypothetical protein evm_006912 [Chilo suppressalis]|nr:hypothetical protein evm_006912 [Chilo suppressalis]